MKAPTLKGILTTILIVVFVVSVFPLVSYFPTERQTIGLFIFEFDPNNDEDSKDFYLGYEVHPTENIWVKLLNGDVISVNQPGVALYVRYLYKTDNIQGPQIYAVYETRWFLVGCLANTNNFEEGTCQSHIKEEQIPSEPAPQPQQSGQRA